MCQKLKYQKRIYEAQTRRVVVGWCVVFGEYSRAIFGIEDYDGIDGEKRHIGRHNDNLRPIGKIMSVGVGSVVRGVRGGISGAGTE